MVHYCEIKRNCWRVIYFELTPIFLISQSKARLQVSILSLSLIVSNSMFTPPLPLPLPSEVVPGEALCLRPGHIHTITNKLLRQMRLKDNIETCNLAFDWLIKKMGVNSKYITLQQLLFISQ